MRSSITIDLGAFRRNLRTLLRVLDGGATVLCVATVPEALALRGRFPDARLLVLGPADDGEVAQARDARLELTASTESIPDGVPVHVKLDTGMGRWGVAELPSLDRRVVGLMTHLATADSDPAFAREQVARFREATDAFSHLTRHIANSAAALRLPESRLDAARCGIALYGLSPFGTDAAEDGLEPVLSWQSELVQVKRLRAGESTGYGRRFVATADTWIGIVPVGYGDGLSRDLTGTDVVVAGERRKVVGTISMDAFAVRLDRELRAGTRVTIVGEGVSLDDHARVAGTISYELACGIDSSPERAVRTVTGR